VNPPSDKRLLEPARIDPTGQDEAYCNRFGDIYYSRAGGFEEKHHVFVAGNGLPDRFANGTVTRVLEFGFGTGLSFLVTAQALLQTTNPNHGGPELHFFSIEKHPLSREDMLRLVSPWPVLHALAEELADQWPDLVPGFHRRNLAGGRITLTLVFGDVAQVLPQITGPFDAFFLDGFSPGLNTDMWSDSVFRHLPRLSAPGARVATYSSARSVADGLAAVGFQISHLPGYGAKKTMLTGVLSPSSVPHPTPRPSWDQRSPVVVIGAGVAGLTTARALARRGIAVQVFDSAEDLGAGGSGNAAGIVCPLISMDWSELSQLTAFGLGYLRADWARLQGADVTPGGCFSGVIQLARDARHQARQSLIADTLRLDPEFARWLSAEALSVMGGVPVTQPGWFFPRAGWLIPGDYLQALADHPLIELKLGIPIAQIIPQDASWQGLDTDGHHQFESGCIVLANADALGDFLPEIGEYITACRGQVSVSTRQNARTGLDISMPMMREGYGLDLPDGRRVFGASFKPGDQTLVIRMSEQLENGERLAAINPELCRSLEAVSHWQARVALRATTPDRLPFVGRVESKITETSTGMSPLLYVNAGHGSRGFTWCGLLAESLAAEILGEPSPLPTSLRVALEPTRFARREARRRASLSIKGRAPATD
jgi:tRNA 5-methylaminomethyl-2-thiouridine biosynthesis bifunctional protein